jgi:hypothetical protein
MSRCHNLNKLNNSPAELKALFKTKKISVKTIAHQQFQSCYCSMEIGYLVRS